MKHFFVMKQISWLLKTPYIQFWIREEELIIVPSIQASTHPPIHLIERGFTALAQRGPRTVQPGTR